MPSSTSTLCLCSDETSIHHVYCLLKNPSLPYISARYMPAGGGGGGGGSGGGGVICYCGVTYNFIQSHNQCRDLHQFFSCLFETFSSMSEIMFSSDSMSKKKYFFNSWKYMNVYFRFQNHCFGMVGKQLFKNVRMTVIFLICHF